MDEAGAPVLAFAGAGPRRKIAQGRPRDLIGSYLELTW